MSTLHRTVSVDLVDPERRDMTDEATQASQSPASQSPASQSLARRLKRCPEPLVEHYDAAILDLDGVVYVGDTAVDGVAQVLATARQRDVTIAFVTNNASRTPESIAAALTGLGVQAEPDDVVTSAQAAARAVADRVPPGSPVLVIGAEGLLSAVRQTGLVPVDSSDADPVAVVQGFGPDVGWQQLTEGAVAIRQGAIWVASNTDLTLPTARGPAPGNGAFVNALAAAVGTRPAVVAGKPHRPLFDETIRRTGSRLPLVVGDRLDTDIEGAVNCGADSLLVLTGVTDVPSLLKAAPGQRPSYVAWTLEGLVSAHEVPSRSGADWRLGSWVGSVIGGRLQVSGPPQAEPDDALRLATTAAWDWSDDNSGDDLRLDDVLTLFGQLGLLREEGVPHARR